MMIMKWEDLEPGDVLEINPEYLETDWVASLTKEAPKFFVIKDIDYNSEDDIMHLFFSWHKGAFSIRKNNGALWSSPYGSPFFHIVSLKVV